MSKVNETGDVQSLNTFALAFAVNSAFSVAATETASASSSTSITATGATSHATNDAKGAMIVANTSVYTVDRWYTIAGAASGSSPSTSGPFMILPCMAPFYFVALSDDVAAVAGTETGVAIPVTGGKIEHSTNGLARQKITSITRTAGSAITYTVTRSTTFEGFSQRAGPDSAGKEVAPTSPVPECADGASPGLL